MAVISDFECKFCGHTYEAWTDSTVCHRCGGFGRKCFTAVNSFEWGGPRFDNALQRSFSSRSELKSWLKANGMMESPARDKFGGAYPNNIEAPRVSRVHFDPRSPSSRGKGTSKRLDSGY